MFRLWSRCIGLSGTTEEYAFIKLSETRFSSEIGNSRHKNFRVGSVKRRAFDVRRLFPGTGKNFQESVDELKASEWKKHIFFVSLV